MGPPDADLVPPAEGSELALALLRVDPGAVRAVGDVGADTLLHVVEGTGTLSLGTEGVPLDAGSAALVLAGEEVSIEASAPLTLSGSRSGRGGPPRAARPARGRRPPRGLALGGGDGRALVPDPLRTAQRLHPGDALRRVHPARESALALPPVRRDRVRPGGACTSPRRSGRARAPRRVRLPSPTPAGAHRREHERGSRADDHRRLHARREPVGRVSHSGRRGRLPLRGLVGRRPVLLYDAG